MDAVRHDGPEPGRPRTLGEKVDAADAADLLAVIRAAKGVIERHGRSGGMHLAREALWELWERPRLPRPLVSSKYPTSYPWSPSARRAYEAAQGARPKQGWGLVLEHLVPRGLLVADLVERSQALTTPELIGLLRSRLVAAVVTRTEDRALAGAGVAKGFPVHANPSDDPWSRYRMAGLDVAEFRPLDPT